MRELKNELTTAELDTITGGRMTCIWAYTDASEKNLVYRIYDDNRVINYKDGVSVSYSGMIQSTNEPVYITEGQAAATIAQLNKQYPGIVIRQKTKDDPYPGKTSIIPR